MRAAQPDLKLKPLTPRQANALQMTLDGYRKNEICDKLGITQKTLWTWRRLPAWNEQLNVAVRDSSGDGEVHIRTLLPLATIALKKLILTGTDNTPTISQVNKGTVTSEGPATGLCHLACAHQRHHRCCLKAWFLPGEVNVMSGNGSRLQHLSDTELLSHFEWKYPQPTPWVLHPLPSQTALHVISALVHYNHRAPDFHKNAIDLPLQIGEFIHLDLLF